MICHVFFLRCPAFLSRQVKFVVADFDAISQNDFIGQAGSYWCAKRRVAGWVAGGIGWIITSDYGSS